MSRTSTQELDRAQFAETISEMEEKLAEKEGSELDHAIERLDHFKSIQHELNTTASIRVSASRQTFAKIPIKSAPASPVSGAETWLRPGPSDGILRPQMLEPFFRFDGIETGSRFLI